MSIKYLKHRLQRMEAVAFSFSISGMSADQLQGKLVDMLYEASQGEEHSRQIALYLEWLERTKWQDPAFMRISTAILGGILEPQDLAIIET